MQALFLGHGKHRRRAIMLGAVVVAVIAAGGVFPLLMNSTIALGDSIYSDSEGEVMALRSECVYPFKANEAGMTYGTLDDAPDGQEPDLIFARATNGKSGFISKAEWDEASAANLPTSELCATQDESEEAAAKLLRDEINDDINGAELTLEGALGIIEATHVGDTPEVDYASIAEEATLHLVPSNGAAAKQPPALTAEVVEENYLDVVEATTIYIPVYEIDGSTVIGEFPVTQV